MNIAADLGEVILVHREQLIGLIGSDNLPESLDETIANIIFSGYPELDYYAIQDPESVEFCRKQAEKDTDRPKLLVKNDTKK